MSESGLLFFAGASMVWLQFLICGVVIFFAGSKLSNYGDIIAEKLGLSKSWVGLLLMGTIASSSQLIMAVSAVVFHDLPDMAVGALLGSSMFNMLVVGLLDLFSKNKPVSNMVNQGQILSAGFGIILLGFAVIDILFGKHLPAISIMHRMDPITLSFIPIWLFAMRITYRFEQAQIQEDVKKEMVEGGAEKRTWLGLMAPFVLCAILIIAASSYLPEIAEKIQKQTGWGQSFVGLSFIAITTCLPEIAVSTSAARRGSFDVAVASLMGSNLFYMVIIAITDFCYLKGVLLRGVSALNALAGLTAIVSMAIVIIALTYRSEKKTLFLAGDAIALVLVYAFANVLLFMDK